MLSCIRKQIIFADMNDTISSGTFQTIQVLDTKFHDYQLVETSEAGYAELYSVVSGRRKLMLKVVKNEEGKTTENLMRLQREYQLMELLSGNEHVVNLISWRDDVEVGPCIVMEYVDGTTLDVFLASHPTLKERRRIFYELLDAVDFLHTKQVIHNDLKPSNILVTRVGHHIKLIDFGYSDCDVQIDKATGGTLGFASPELEKRQTLDCSSDIYSLGLLMREMLPHRYRHTTAKCLRKDPQARYQSVGELRRAMQRKKKAIMASASLLVLAVLVFSLSMMFSLRTEKENPDPFGLHDAYDSVYCVYESQIQQCVDSEEYHYFDFCDLYRLGFGYTMVRLYQANAPDDFEGRKLFDSDYQPYYESLLSRLVKQYENLPRIEPIRTEQPQLYDSLRDILHEKTNNLYKEFGLFQYGNNE